MIGVVSAGVSGFRPLSGSYRFLCQHIRLIVLVLSVSVPCRGLIGFYRWSWWFYFCSKNVSVPCRGLIGFYDITDAQEREAIIIVSVPCRGLIGFYCSATSIIPRMRCSFRPLSGSYRFLYCHHTGYDAIDAVSVPCRGLIAIFKSNRKNAKCVSVPCRGLIGFYRNWQMNKTMIKVSVPCRGLIGFYCDLIWIL